MHNLKDINLPLSKISQLMKKESPVFIIGGSRSGSSILYRVLQRHSSFKPYNTKNKTRVELTESRVFYRFFSSTDCTNNKNPLRYLLNNNSYYNQFLDKTKWIRLLQRYLCSSFFIKKFATKFNLFRPSLYKLTFNVLLLRTFFYYAKQARGMARILEKTPSHVDRIPEIKVTFPRAKFIHIYRHPIDVYSSYKRRLKIDLELGIDESKLTWLMLSPLEFCELYKTRIQIVFQEYYSNPHQFMLIRYEDFISNPELVICRTCNFLDELYEKDCLPEDKNEYPEFREEKMYPNLFGKVKKPTKKWHEYISEADAVAIEDNLVEVMNQLQYHRYTNTTQKTSAMLVANCS